MESQEAQNADLRHQLADTAAKARELQAQLTEAQEALSIAASQDVKLKSASPSSSPSPSRRSSPLATSQPSVEVVTLTDPGAENDRRRYADEVSRLERVRTVCSMR